MYVIFGAGKNGKLVFDRLENSKVAFWIDNDRSKWGKSLDGVAIYSLEEKLDEIDKYTILICASKENDIVIRKQLDEKGISNYISVQQQICYGYDNFKNLFGIYDEIFNNNYLQYYAEQESFSTSNIFPEQYKKEEEFLFEHFIPLLDQDAEIADLGCASGEWSYRLSKRCKKVDGYDYSEKMIGFAKKNYIRDNLEFSQFDLRQDDLKKKYDGIVLYGVLMYVYDKLEIQKILKMIKRALKQNGYLVIKETLNITGSEDTYVLNPITGYTACYRTQNEYYKFFYDEGYRLVDEILLMSRKEAVDDNGYISRGCIWKKVID